jgi:hypothetical protein
MQEVAGTLQRYLGLYAMVKDEATADKAVAEINSMSARLRVLASEIGKMPHAPGEDKQRVLGDPDLSLKFLAGHQSFMAEGVLPLAQAILARQPAASPTPPTASPAQPGK